MAAKSSKKQMRRNLAQQKQARWRMGRFILLGTLAVVAGFFFVRAQSPAKSDAVSFPHLHGLAFSPDGEQLIVPAHDGFRIYSNGAWSIPEDVPRRDYMGYSVVEGGFYSSGHPEPGSVEANPLGLIRSEDLGSSLTVLGFEGESDFHVMAAGYYNKAIYVHNPAANSRLQAGLHYSLDEGATWEPAPADGLIAQPIQLAVHPTEPGWLAVGTEAGLFYSEHFGEDFVSIGDPQPVSAIAFTLSGEGLLFAAPGIVEYEIESGEVTGRNAPDMDNGDRIIFIAQSPADPDTLAVATSNVSIFYSQDGGGTWARIVKDGVAQ